MNNPTAQQVAAMFGCTVEQVRAQYAKNAEQLAGMARKANTTGIKVNGYTGKQLSAMAANARQRSGQ